MNSSDDIILESFQELLDWVRKDGVTHSVDKDRQRILVPTSSDSFEGHLAIYWGEDVPFIQFVHALDFQVPEHSIPNIERAIILLNHQLDITGFGFNHLQSLLYFRTMLPLRPLSNGLLKEEFQFFCRYSVNTVNEYYVPFRGIALGNRSPEEFLSSSNSR